ncbi:type II toxin-antitoxin system CcdA family antitoxin [Pseudonocardia alaniniphila]|uniref:Type II toxin-antitoxin system CcdA family antitoxin n=1 Tax=Pseudonocardia alaniniphila TaxID=75291 RepID=A0ABS9TI01_9PSEU|nr:type II toxin-antitoxin system CcdA family antitoxin [Pseudonocardia alaniniphila]MCH6168137.1 type II toxin-antitoxin system CcdA family antitoxin [Pseudonocardia alaniniphila]
MSSDRVTVSLPAEVRLAAQRVAQEAGVPFSAVVTEALETWVRGRLIDAWLVEYQAEHGAFDEAELREIAAEAGVAYIPPSPSRTVA